MSSNYYLDRNRNNMRKLNDLLGDLPPFCSVFFIGIQDITTPLTRLNYAVDLKLFFNYLVTYETSFYNKPIQSILLSDIDEIDFKKRSKVIKALKDFYDNYPNEKKGMYIHGSFGSGKTFLASCLLNELAKKDYIKVVMDVNRDGKINGKDATKIQEFEDYQWFDLEDIMETVIPFKRTVYEQVIKEFRPFIEHLKTN